MHDLQHPTLPMILYRIAKHEDPDLAAHARRSWVSLHPHYQQQIVKALGKG